MFWDKFFVFLIIFGVVVIMLQEEAKDEIMITNQTIIFSQGIFDEINQDYLHSAEINTENAYCLLGTISEKQILIKQLIRPNVKNASTARITIEGCDEARTVGTLHHHVGTLPVCSLSEIDINSSIKVNFAIAGVTCGDKKMAFFNKPNFKNELGWAVIK